MSKHTILKKLIINKNSNFILRIFRSFKRNYSNENVRIRNELKAGWLFPFMKILHNSFLEYIVARLGVLFLLFMCPINIEQSNPISP